MEDKSKIKDTSQIEIISEGEKPANITEGKAVILGEGNVFYNPVQQFNRDLSIVVLTTYFETLQNENFEKLHKSIDGTTGEVPKAGVKYENGMTILEALSATGLRSIRYAKEIPGVQNIIANDLSQQAVDAITENIKMNKIEDLVTPNKADATSLMYLSTSYDKRFTVIDLDPYGCPTKFLDGAIQSVKDGGILLITATDMAVLAGNTPETCYVKYGAIPLKSKSCHEMALRILLKAVESHATRYGRYIKPLLSISADFYIRIFVRVFSSQQECKKSTSKLSTVYQCAGCDTMTLQSLGVLKSNPTEQNPNQIKYCLPIGPPVNTYCEFCMHRHHVGGPIYSDPIHDMAFVESLLATVLRPEFSYLHTMKRIIGMLSVVKEELPDVPLYYTIENLCSTLKLEGIPILKFRSALLHERYRVSFSHACKTSIKTDAPMFIIWDIMRAWAKINPVKGDRYKDGTPLKAILSVEATKEYIFNDIHPLANPLSRKSNLSRFQQNPTSHWGPGTRGTLLIVDLLGEAKTPKQIKNQNKKKKKRNMQKINNSLEETAAKQLKLDTDSTENEQLIVGNENELKENMKEI